MGRKGVGKLAALSISNGFKLVTVCDKHCVGLFIPNRIEHDDETLKVLNPSEFSLKKITTHGTAIIMESPKVAIPKLQDTALKNLAKIFPNDIKILRFISYLRVKKNYWFRTKKMRLHD